MSFGEALEQALEPLRDRPERELAPRERRGAHARAVSGLRVLGAVVPGVEARAEDAAPSGEDEAVRVPGERAGAFVSEAREGSTPRELTDVGSLVATLPGVHVRRLGSDDSFATLSVRGTSSSQVAIVMAGVPLTGGADPTLDLAALPLWPGTRARVGSVDWNWRRL